jgi:hypothetical protein
MSILLMDCADNAVFNKTLFRVLLKSDISQAAVSLPRKAEWTQLQMHSGM